jgi:hypothetical protein
MRILSVVPAIAACVALAATAGQASESLKYNPGKWETQTTMRMPMMPEPQMRTSTECLREGDYSAERLMRDQQGCKVSSVDVKERSLEWTVSCPGANGGATGRGEYNISADGESGQGKITIDVDMQGQKMSMTMDVKSHRVGDCD